MKQADLTIGILGGMGPEACAEFHRQLIHRNPATCDQDHFRILVLDDPRIPDRSAFIQGHGEDPRPALREKARQLEAYGASFIAVPCNTAHYFWNDIQQAVSIPVLHIVTATLEAISADVRRVGLLSTRGTVSAGLYTNPLQTNGFEPVLPDEATQQRVEALIASVKAGGDRSSQIEELQRCCSTLGRAGAQSIILGCTELGLLTDGWSNPAEVPLLDSLGLLAEATLAEARRLERPNAAVSTG